MFLDPFNLGHALPLTFVRFSCYARRRAQRRGRFAMRDVNAAIGGASNANRICEPSHQLRHRNFATPCCVSAARCAACDDSHPLPAL